MVEVLALKPSMTVADVGAGGGAMTVVLARRLVSGRVLATDINPGFLAEIREYVKREGLSNVTLIEGAPASTNLPASCCDAILLRNVYHHLTEPETFITSVIASLKPDGQLAIVDFPARPGSALPKRCARQSGRERHTEFAGGAGGARGGAHLRPDDPELADWGQNTRLVL